MCVKMSLCMGLCEGKRKKCGIMHELWTGLYIHVALLHVSKRLSSFPKTTPRDIYSCRQRNVFCGKNIWSSDQLHMKCH